MCLSITGHVYWFSFRLSFSCQGDQGCCYMLDLFCWLICNWTNARKYY